MKSMKDRKMDMVRGEPESTDFFPEEPHYRTLSKTSEIRGFNYPDKEEDVLKDQEGAIKDASRNQPKLGFRH